MRTGNAEMDEDLGQPDGAWVIDNGWDVFASDGEKVGEVEDVQPRHLVVGKGLIFHTEWRLPVSAIINVENGRVHLNITAQDIDSQDWDQIPDAEDDESATAPGAIDDDVAAEAGAGALNGSKHRHVPLAAEELAVQTRAVDRGTVHVRTDTVAETRTIDAPLREEELHVQRFRVAREYTTDEIPADAFQEIEIEIPIRGEEVANSTRPVVREEVDISKVVRERHQHLTETVRREELHVDGAPDPTIANGSDGIGRVS